MTTSMVLDASTTLSWAFTDEADEQSDAIQNSLISGHAWVPSLWSYEVANGLLVGLRRARLSVADIEAFTADLAILDIRLAPPGPEIIELVAQAEVSGLTAYDAAYLQLARSLDIPLATRDKALASAARIAGVALLRSS